MGVEFSGQQVKKLFGVEEKVTVEFRALFLGLGSGLQAFVFFLCEILEEVGIVESERIQDLPNLVYEGRLQLLSEVLRVDDVLD